MKRAIVTGASGFIGGHFCQRLRNAGVQVETLSPQLSDDWHEVLEGAEVCFHLGGLAHDRAGSDQVVAVNALQTQKLFVACMEAGVERFVWLSSIKVLGDVAPEALLVEAPYDPHGVYAQSKMQGERELFAAMNQLATPDRLAIVRPPLVYGPGVKANFASMLRWCMSGVPLPLGSARAGRAWLSIDNLVSFLQQVATRDLHGQSLWHVRDDEQTSVAEILRALAEIADRPMRLLPLPKSWAMKSAELLGRSSTAQRLFEPLLVDVSQSKTLLGWQPEESQAEGLAKVVRWYQSQR